MYADIAELVARVSARMSHDHEQPHVINTQQARRKARTCYLVLPLVVAPSLLLVYVTAQVFLPPAAHELVPEIVWTPGVFTEANGTFSVCPIPLLCSSGGFEMFLLITSRRTGWAIYVPLLWVFMSKMSGTLHFLSRTVVGVYVPLEYMHSLHRSAGKAVLVLAWVHGIAHYTRISVRGEHWVHTNIGWKMGLTALICFTASASVMAAKRLRRAIKFETRWAIHWYAFLAACIALLAHAQSTIRLSLAVGITLLVWGADKLYVLLFKTFRVDDVEITALHTGGTQISFVNPQGFEPKSGEYVRVLIPWLSVGPFQWHPFSIYTDAM